MNVNGQLFGREAIREGYTHDSMGLAIDPNAMYDYRAIPYTELTYLCRSGLTPKEEQPVTRRP